MDPNSERNGLIVSALSKLDHENNDHWTQGGEPDIATVAKIAGIDGLKRADIQQASPDFKRRERPAEAKAKGEKPKIENEEVKLKPNGARPKSAKDEKVTLAKKVERMLMRATAPGYYKGDLKDVGDIFVFTGRPGSWMEPA